LSKFVPGLSAEGLDLLELMLIHDPLKRISAKEALKHPYLKDVPDAIKNMK
jgi:serine/threonine protein kinase